MTSTPSWPGSIGPFALVPSMYNSVVTAPASDGSLVVPAYSSLPGAAATLYLDFDGDSTAVWGSYQPGDTPAYDIDGNVTALSGLELDYLKQIFDFAAEGFSPFQINVTTVAPGPLADGEAYRVVVGGHGDWRGGSAGGTAYRNSFTDPLLPN